MYPSKGINTYLINFHDFLRFFRSMSGLSQQWKFWKRLYENFGQGETDVDNLNGNKCFFPVFVGIGLVCSIFQEQQFFTRGIFWSYLEFMFSKENDKVRLCD